MEGMEVAWPQGPWGKRTELSPDNNRELSGIRQVEGLLPSSISRPLHIVSGGLTTVTFFAPASKRGAANTRWDVVGDTMWTDRPHCGPAV
jgi:hypothetical protein